MCTFSKVNGAARFLFRHIYTYTSVAENIARDLYIFKQSRGNIEGDITRPIQLYGLFTLLLYIHLPVRKFGSHAAERVFVL